MNTEEWKLVKAYRDNPDQSRKVIKELKNKLKGRTINNTKPKKKLSKRQLKKTKFKQTNLKWFITEVGKNVKIGRAHV